MEVLGYVGLVVGTVSIALLATVESGPWTTLIVVEYAVFVMLKAVPRCIRGD